MALQQFFKQLCINNKDIFIVDDHHKALAAWAQVRRTVSQPANLITIDHHTDTREAFLGHAYWEASEDRVSDQEAFRQSLVAQIDWRSDLSIAQAIAHLRHDEHIDAATCSGVLDMAFCMQLSDGWATQSIEERAYMESRQKQWPFQAAGPRPQRPMTYAPAPNRVYALPFDCFIGCDAMPHNDACELRRADEIIESRYLDDQLARGAEIARCFGLPSLEAAPYILDIDLDVFHTLRAIRPQDPQTFYRLIRGALAITIATEAECVEDEWLDEDNEMEAEELLQALLEHFETALK